MVIGRILIVNGSTTIVISIVNFLIMTPVHFCFRRINPSLNIDLCQVGTLEGEGFAPLSDDRLSALDLHLDSVGLRGFISRSDICRDAYVMHGSIREFLAAVSVERIDWFQDTLIVVVPVDFDNHEPSKKEE